MPEKRIEIMGIFQIGNLPCLKNPNIPWGKMEKENSHALRGMGKYNNHKYP